MATETMSADYYWNKLRKAMILVVYDGLEIESNGSRIFNDGGGVYVVRISGETDREFHSIAEAVDYFYRQSCVMFRDLRISVKE